MKKSLKERVRWFWAYNFEEFVTRAYMLLLLAVGLLVFSDSILDSGNVRYRSVQVGVWSLSSRSVTG